MSERSVGFETAPVPGGLFDDMPTQFDEGNTFPLPLWETDRKKLDVLAQYAAVAFGHPPALPVSLPPFARLSMVKMIYSFPTWRAAFIESLGRLGLSVDNSLSELNRVLQKVITDAQPRRPAAQIDVRRLTLPAELVADLEEMVQGELIKRSAPIFHAIASPPPAGPGQGVESPKPEFQNAAENGTLTPRKVVRAIFAPPPGDAGEGNAAPR